MVTFHHAPLFQAWPEGAVRVSVLDGQTAKYFHRITDPDGDITGHVSAVFGYTAKWGYLDPADWDTPSHTDTIRWFARLHQALVAGGHLARHPGRFLLTRQDADTLITHHNDGGQMDALTLLEGAS